MLCIGLLQRALPSCSSIPTPGARAFLERSRELREAKLLGALPVLEPCSRQIEKDFLEDLEYFFRS